MINIKKYSNRRLYNTNTKKYITQDDVVDLIKNQKDFSIIDVDTEKDITSTVLTQIILDKETSGTKLIPIDFLKQIILYYENNKSNDMFGYINQMYNFANSNNLFEEGYSNFMKMNPFSFNNFFNQKNDSTTSNSSEKENLNDEVEKLRKQIDEIQKNLNTKL